MAKGNSRGWLLVVVGVGHEIGIFPVRWKTKAQHINISL